MAGRKKRAIGIGICAIIAITVYYYHTRWLPISLEQEDQTGLYRILQEKKIPHKIKDWGKVILIPSRFYDEVQKDYLRQKHRFPSQPVLTSFAESTKEIAPFLVVKKKIEAKFVKKITQVLDPIVHKFIVVVTCDIGEYSKDTDIEHLNITVLLRKEGREARKKSEIKLFEKMIASVLGVSGNSIALSKKYSIQIFERDFHEGYSQIPFSEAQTFLTEKMVIALIFGGLTTLGYFLFRFWTHVLPETKPEVVLDNNTTMEKGSEIKQDPADPSSTDTTLAFIKEKARTHPQLVAAAIESWIAKQQSDK